MWQTMYYPPLTDMSWPPNSWSDYIVDRTAVHVEEGTTVRVPRAKTIGSAMINDEAQLQIWNHCRAGTPKALLEARPLRMCGDI
jgi:hypothetical protein